MSSGPGDGAVLGKRRLIVLFGGRSAEHDVSCTSAVSVLRSLDAARYDIVPIGVTRDGAWVRSETADKLLAGGEAPARLAAIGPAVSFAELLARPDAALPAPDRGTPGGYVVPAGGAEPLPVVLPILHGPFGEDGTMQGLLELAGLPYVGSGVAGSAVAMDKVLAKQLLQAAGLPQARFLGRPAWELGDAGAVRAFASETERALGWPVFVKPANLGSSIGVSKAADPAEFSAAVTHALDFDDWIVVEESITGREIEFAVLGNEDPIVSGAGEIVPAHDFYDYEDKYLEDGAQLLIPAPLSADELAEGQRLAIATFKALRAEGLARVDFFYEAGGRGWLVNEANTMPGFTPISMYPKLWAAAGFRYADLLDRLIELALARHQRRAARIGKGRG